MITFLTNAGYAQFWKRKKVIEPTDTLPKNSPITPADSARFMAKDSTSNLLKKKSTPKKDIETTLEYEAEDSIVIDAQDKTAFLFKKSVVKYGNKKMTAHTLDVDYKTNLVTAKYGEDTTGKKFDIPVFQEGSDTYQAHEIQYNYKKSRGKVKNIVTKQGEGIVHGQLVKKEPDNIMFVEGAKYTTCDLHEPHYAIKATTIKFIPGKKIVSRAFNLQIHDIPTPIAFPFGLFPFSKKRASGVIIPSYGEVVGRGFSLIDGGFYWATNPYMGMRFTGDFYTNGGSVYKYNLDYRNRYAFTGNLNMQYTNVYLSRDNPVNQGYQEGFRVMWSHSTTAKTTGRLSASVNIFTNNFNQNTQFDPNVRQQGQQQSSVNYSNEIRKTPFNYALSMRQSQDNRGKMDFSLPDFSLNMRQIFPLREVPFINKIDWVKKLNFRITSTFTNSFSNVVQNSPPSPFFDIYGLSREPLTLTGLNSLITNAPLNAYDTAVYNNARRKFYRQDTLQMSELLRRFGVYSNWKINHSIPVSTSIRLLKYFNLNPFFSLNETWYKQSFAFRDWDSVSRAVKIDTLRSFVNSPSIIERQYNWNSGASMTTRIYGTFYIKKWNLEALRHTINPTVGISYTPDLSSQNLYNGTEGTRVNEAGRRLYFNRFTGQGSSTLNGLKDNTVLNFGVVNQLELKVRNNKDTTKIAYNKIMLLDNFSVNSSYNFRLDSFNLSTFVLAARTRILIFDINFTGNVDPYYYQSRGVSTLPGSFNTRLYQRRNIYDWNQITEAESGESIDLSKKNSVRLKDFGIGKFINFNFSVGANFKPAKNEKRKIQALSDGTDLQFMRQPIPPYVDWSVPWSLSVNYIVNYAKYTSQGILFLDKPTVTNNITLRGDVAITEKWRINGYTGINILPEKTDLSTTGLSIVRDLHCWQASITWTRLPFNGTDAFFATIGIKAATLRDVKLERRSQPF